MPVQANSAQGQRSEFVKHGRLGKVQIAQSAPRHIHAIMHTHAALGMGIGPVPATPENLYAVKKDTFT
jgi:hypothetical protein